MGYYTRYDGKVTGPSVLVNAFADKYEDEQEQGNYGFQPYDFVRQEFFGGESLTWYEHEKDILALSKEHPNLLFHLQGEGEESGDIWKKWFRNGKSVTAQARIVFDEPDLDTVLPSANVEAELEQIRASKRAVVVEEIRALEKKLADLG